MKQRQVILRRRSMNTGQVLLGTIPGFNPTTVDNLGEGFKLSVDELGDRDLRILSQDKDVVMVAPVMPMILIEPKASGGIAAAAPAAPAWGVTAVGADRSPYTGDGVVAAVIDTGIAPSHEAFAGVSLVRRNFTTESDDDQHGHGTHCAGTIFGRPVGGTRIGVAPGIKKAIIAKVLGAGGGTSDRVADAINWSVEQGANVISMSLGIDFTRDVADWEARGLPHPAAVSRALEGFRLNVELFSAVAGFVKAQGTFGRPALLIAAAGNESGRNAQRPFTVSVSPPAVSNGFVAVAALGRAAGGFEVAEFSNAGANIAGPGVDIVSARLGGGLTLMSGTSMATPHVAGVAALWAQKIRQLGSLRVSEWTHRVLSSGTMSPLAPGTVPTDVGSGMVQAPAN